MTSRRLKFGHRPPDVQVVLDYLHISIEGDRVVYETDVERARRAARVARNIGRVLMALTLAPIWFGGLGWFLAFILLVFGGSYLRHAKKLEGALVRTVIDREQGTLVRDCARAGKNPSDAVSVERSEFALREFDAIRVGWYTQRTVQKGRSTTREAYMLVRLDGAEGGVILARFGARPPEHALAHARELADVLGLPIERESIRSDPGYFQRLAWKEGGDTEPPQDDRPFVRLLRDDEPDAGLDLDQPRAAWTPLAETANRARMYGHPF